MTRLWGMPSKDHVFKHNETKKYAQRHRPMGSVKKQVLRQDAMILRFGREVAFFVTSKPKVKESKFIFNFLLQLQLTQFSKVGKYCNSLFVGRHHFRSNMFENIALVMASGGLLTCRISLKRGRFRYSSRGRWRGLDMPGFLANHRPSRKRRPSTCSIRVLWALGEVGIDPNQLTWTKSCWYMKPNQRTPKDNSVEQLCAKLCHFRLHESIEHIPKCPNRLSLLNFQKSFGGGMWQRNHKHQNRNSCKTSGNPQHWEKLQVGFFFLEKTV